MITRSHTVPPQTVSRIDVVVQKLTGRSRTQVRGLFDHGCVSLNGVVCADPGTQASTGQTVTVEYDEHRNYKERKTYHSSIFKLVFEDDALLVIDKQAGYLTVPNSPNDRNTVVDALSQYISRGQKLRRKVAIVHRLDRDTSGLLVFAKSERFSQQLKSQFEMKKPRRHYLAIVAGRLDAATGTFRSHLFTDQDLNQRSTTDPKQGKLAVTHYEVLEAYAEATLVRVRLETGRRNQIRVHFAEAGHPVLGDARYETQRAHHPRWKWPRLALHAAELGFKHPVSGKELVFQSPTPEEFAIFAGKRPRT